MGISDFWKRLFGRPAADAEAEAEMETGAKGDLPEPLGLDELCRRLGLDVGDLQAAPLEYSEFSLPKRSGGRRTIAAPNPQLKRIQRRLLRRLLGRLTCHPNVTGFERRHSIVTNALVHAGAAVVIRMDIKDFFTATSAKRLGLYFRRLGWDAVATDCLVRLTTHKGSLPQGAPTSPRLSNLVNYRLDARLAGLAGRFGANYTRYADDLTFSFAVLPDRSVVPDVIRMTKKILGQYGYRLHQKRKLHIRRRHQRQIVTGLVVNHRPALPRATRRRLRAVEHHLVNGRKASLTERQLAGWKALQHMIETQSGPAPSN